MFVIWVVAVAAQCLFYCIQYIYSPICRGEHEGAVLQATDTSWKRIDGFIILIFQAIIFPYYFLLRQVDLTNFVIARSSNNGFLFIEFCRCKYIGNFHVVYNGQFPGVKQAKPVIATADQSVFIPLIDT